MIAATVRDDGIVAVEHPDPRPGAGEVLIAVRAAGINNADLLQRQGRYPPQLGVPPEIPGLELAGEVIELSDGCTRLAVGDRVMGLGYGCAQAERAVVDERLLMTVPEGLDWASAGGFPEVFTVAYEAIFTQGRLSRGERLLVHGGAGGVGTAAIQLGLLAGARPYATVRNEALRHAVAALGATVLAPEGFSSHGPFDVVIEPIGASNLAEDLEALAYGGRISVLGLSGGVIADLDLRVVMHKEAHVTGLALRDRSLEHRATTAREVERNLLPALASGQLRVPVAATFPLAEVGTAYDHFATGGKLGKVVLVMDPLTDRPSEPANHS